MIQTLRLATRTDTLTLSSILAELSAADAVPRRVKPGTLLFTFDNYPVLNSVEFSVVVTLLFVCVVCVSHPLCGQCHNEL